MSPSDTKLDKPVYTPEQLREHLRGLIAKARDAGLGTVVDRVTIDLIVASSSAVTKLEAALAEPAPDLKAQHAAIVESLDADAPTLKAPLAPLRKPPMGLGASPAVRTPPAPKLPPPKAPRRVTGPDAMDAEIPF